MMRFLPADRRLFLRVTLVSLAGAVLLAAAAVLAYALAAARVPEQRAALEELLRAETGLELRFSELGLRWGWHGPEAVFRGVQLSEPGDARTLLTAPQLVVGVDLWRMLRSGDLQIARITLVDPDIDLTPAPAARAARAVPASALEGPAHLLARWRGVRLDVEGGTLRTAAAGAPFAVGIRRIELRRAGVQWSAQALLTLPQTLGASAEALATLRPDAAQPLELSGTLNLSGTRLEFAGWRKLLSSTSAVSYLPRAGSGNATVQMELAHGGVLRASGSVEAGALEWPKAEEGTAGLVLERLHADWRLARTGAGWHLAVAPIGVAGAAQPGASVALDAAADGTWVRGRVQRAPVLLLAGLARSFAPELALAASALSGEAGEATFDWSAARPADERLKTTAELYDLTLTPPGSSVRLGGLAAHVSGDGGRISADVHSANARLTLADDPSFAAGSVAVSARLELDHGGHAWRVGTPDFAIRVADAHLSVRGSLAGEDSGGRAHIDAHATLSGAPVALLRTLLGPRALAALGPAGAALTAGRIERGELTARGPLDQPLPWSAPRGEFSGSLALTGARVAAGEDWPELHELEAHIGWRGARVTVRVGQAVAGSFRVTSASGEWDAREAALTRLSGRMQADAAQALGWLRDHPRLAPEAAALGTIDLRGPTLLTFDVRRGKPYTTRVAALLDGAELRAVPGLPAIEALRGALVFSDGRLQRSALNGQWIGGPIAVSARQRSERDGQVLIVAGRGQLAVGEALAATGADSADHPLEGTADWSAELKLLPATEGRSASWSAHADSSLVAVASHLPEPLSKAAGSVLAAHLESSGSGDAGELRLALGERLRALAVLARRGDLWRIERGALNTSGAAPVLPAGPVLRVEGAVSRLDLPAYAALWRRLASGHLVPALSVELNAAELSVAGRSYRNVGIAADSTAGIDRLELQSAALAGTVRWPAVADATHPVIARLAHLDVPDLEVVAALGPATLLTIDDLGWRGRSLGTFTASFSARTGALDVIDAHLAGASEEMQGTLHCRDAGCRATFQLDSSDAAGTLERLGFRSDLTAAHARSSGTLEWPLHDGTAELERASGLLHMELDDGLTRSAPAEAAPPPLGLLAVPGLVAGLGLPELHFARLTADFAIGGGQAFTSDLHLDGDTEILMRGRIGLLAEDYDTQVWVLKGEERLPAAVRRLGPGPRVAALWLSLRELFSGSDRERAALRLRGTWNAPMVTEP